LLHPGRGYSALDARIRRSRRDKLLPMAHFPEFSGLLTQYLAQRDRSPAWLARRLEVHPGTVSRWLNQVSRPATPELVIRVADLLGIHTPAERQALLAAAGFAYLEGAATVVSTGVTTGSETASHLPQPQVDTLWRPVEVPRHNLPMRLPTLIGRDHDLRAIQEMLQRTEVNLVTLIGPGGVGKTQLALQIASMLLEDFADGVFFISLASLREPELVISAIAQTWDLQRQSNQPLMEIVHTYLRAKRMLLILDNFEHLIAAAPLVSELLANCEHLRIIVTSRELLNVQGEHLYSVPPLSLPEQGGKPSLAAFAKTAAVQLFVQRAQAIIPGFVLDETNAVDIAEICTYLDGLPLAIELVAARIRLLPPRILRQRLLGATNSSFELLQGGACDAPMRHRTLIDAITWSYDLLTAAEQRLFRLLSVFVGGCTLEVVERVSELAGAAGSVSVLEILASLVNKSLIQQGVQPNGELRFSLLELIREYGLEQLQANDELAVAARAHAESYAEFVEIAVAALAGPDHLVWTARLNADHANCRTALHWAITHQHADLAMRFGGTLWSFWLDRGYYREGRQFLSAILQLAGTISRTPARARVLAGLGTLSRAQGDRIEASTSLEEAVSIYREWGDEHGLAVALEKLADDCFFELDLPQVDQLYAEAAALYEKVNDRVGATRVRQQFGFEKYHVGDYKAAQALFEQDLAIYKEQQHEAELGPALCNLGRALFQQQKFAEANQRFAEALSRAQARGDQGLVGYVLYFIGRVAYYQAEYAKAKSLLEESLRICREIGTKAAEIAFPLAFLSDIALAQGDVAAAQSMLREGLTLIYHEHDRYAISLILPHCASLAAIRGQHMHAVQLVAAGHSLYQSLKLNLPPNDQEAFDAPLATACPFLSTGDFAQAWAAGAQMTMAEAVVLALTEISGNPSIDVDQHVSEAHFGPDALRASSSDFEA
jgi:predicted ATPase